MQPVFTYGGMTLPIRHGCLRQGFHKYRWYGNATAGGAYQPGLSDYVIAVRKQTEMYIGPPLLLAATGEAATAGNLGLEMHTQVSGVADI